MRTILPLILLTACTTAGPLDTPTEPPATEPPAEVTTQQLAVCAAGDGVLEAGWSVDNGHGAVSSMSMGPTGSVALAGADGTIKLWDIQSGELGWSSDLPDDPSAAYGAEMATDGPLSTLSFDASGELLIGGDEFGTLGVWSAATGLGQASWQFSDQPITAVAQIEGGQQFAAASTAFGGELRTWYSVEEPGEFMHETALWFVNSLQFDGEEFLVAGDIYGEPALELRSTSFPSVVFGTATLRGISGTVETVANLGEGRFLLGGAGFLGVVSISEEGEEETHAVQELSASFVSVVALDGDTFAAGTEDGRVLLGTLSDLSIHAELQVAPMTDMALVPGGWQLATTGDDGALRLVDCQG